MTDEHRGAWAILGADGTVLANEPTLTDALERAFREYHWVEDHDELLFNAPITERGYGGGVFTAEHLADRTRLPATTDPLDSYEADDEDEEGDDER